MSRIRRDGSAAVGETIGGFQQKWCARQESNLRPSD